MCARLCQEHSAMELTLCIGVGGVRELVAGLTVAHLPSLVSFPSSCGPASAPSTTLINLGAIGSSSKERPVASASAGDSLECRSQTFVLAMVRQ